MTEIDWTNVVKFAGLLLSLVGGVATVPLINKIKTTFNLEGRLTQLVTVAVSVLIAILTLVVTGVISPEPINGNYFLAVLPTVLIASQAEYNRIKNQL